MAGSIGTQLNRAVVAVVTAAELAGTTFFDVAINLQDVPEGMEACISAIDYSVAPSEDLQVTDFAIYESVQFSMAQVAAITLNEVAGGLFASRSKMIFSTQRDRDGVLVFDGNIWRPFGASPLKLRGGYNYGLIGRFTYGVPPANIRLMLNAVGEIVDVVSRRERALVER